jgi:dTDP-4-dehydrorhamnose reductase
MKPVVLITGAAGLIGSYLVRTAARWAPYREVYGMTRQDAELTDERQVKILWNRLRPQAVIHCAALSRAAQCDADPDLAHEVNVRATRRLAELAHDRPFLFLSSDQVFDGTKGCYAETDEVHPVNVYGETKAEAEQVVLRNPAHTVVRIALTAGCSATGDRSFVEDMRKACLQGQVLTLFIDEFRCPLPAGVVARALWSLLDRKRPGLYHLGGGERMSRWDIGLALARWHPELSPCLRAGSLRDYAGPRRPADLSMNSDKIQQLLPFHLPGFHEWLASRPHPGGDLWDYAEPE